MTFAFSRKDGVSFNHFDVHVSGLGDASDSMVDRGGPHSLAFGFMSVVFGERDIVVACRFAHSAKLVERIV